MNIYILLLVVMISFYL